MQKWENKVITSTQFHSKTIQAAFCFCTCLIFASCSLAQQKEIEGTESSSRNNATGLGPKRLDSSAPVQFKLAPPAGREEKTRFYSNSYTKNYEDEQLIHERSEIVEFMVRTRVISTDPATQQTTTLIETVLKDGPVDLHDLAFPEPGEKLFTTVDPNGIVGMAGNYPRDSIFYVPSIPFPNRPVKVGDTWTNTYFWRGLKNQVRLMMNITSVFKAIYQCSDNNPCAEIELSGTVQIPDLVSEELKLNSEVRGRILVHIPTGAIVWSEMRNKESIKTGKVRIEVMSCMEGLIEFPERDHWVWRNIPKCDPDTIIPERLPGT